MKSSPLPRFERSLVFLFHEKAGKQKGFILVMVLFFLLMMSVLVLTLLDSTHLALRISQNYASASQQFQVAEAGLKIAEERLATLSKKHINTWHDELDYAAYRIIVDVQRLGLAFCIDRHIAYHYRITARAKPLQGHAVVLQSTYAKRVDEACRGKEAKLIQEGRSSWREL